MKKILSVLLAVLFCVGVCTVAGSAADRPKAGDIEVGKTFSYGWYPQKRVDDLETIEKLNETKLDAVAIDGAFYCAARLDTPSIPGGKGTHFAGVYGYYGSETYWFSFAPIQWVVLENDKDAGSVLLMAKQVLDTHAFDSASGADSVWKDSEIAKWLNNAFLNTAFSAKEQESILAETVVNDPNPVRGTYDGVPSYFKGAVSGGAAFVGTPSGANTNDKVFLPSFADITNPAYGFNVGFNWIGDHGENANYYVDGADSGRQATATDYAECRGVWTNTNESNTAPANEFRRYWLRTAGEDGAHATGVLEDGRVSVTGWPVNYNVLGIRPMIRVKADAVADNRIWINFPEGRLRYRNPDVQLTASQPVTWSSSDESVATIDQNGVLTVHKVGTAEITATLIDDPSTSVTGTIEVRYTWWQWIIRIVFFGWIWY